MRRTIAVASGLLMVVVVVGSLFCVVGCKEKGKTTTPTLFVNQHCPITGEAIDPSSVPASLIREYKGQKVAFCCATCPPAWDKLTDAEKDAKLAKAQKK